MWRNQRIDSPEMLDHYDIMTITDVTHFLPWLQVHEIANAVDFAFVSETVHTSHLRLKNGIQYFIPL